MNEKLDRVIEMRTPDRPHLRAGLKLVRLPLPAEYFAGRDEYLKTIETCFEFPLTSVELRKRRGFVFYGTGGMGKIQLALKFIDEHSDRYVS